MQISRNDANYPGAPILTDVDVFSTYRNTGQLASYRYGWLSAQTSLQATRTVSYQFGSVSRVSEIDDDNADTSGVSSQWVSGVQYDFAGRLAGFTRAMGGGAPDATETMTYNTSGQLTAASYGSTSMHYNFTAGQNNGQVATVNDVSGETLTYQYDALKRLVSAASTGGWTQSFGYGGFGNLTSKTLNGTVTSIPVNGAMNRLVNAVYDANGNMTSGSGVTMVYDSSNRLVQATTISGGGRRFTGIRRRGSGFVRWTPAGTRSGRCMGRAGRS